MNLGQRAEEIFSALKQSQQQITIDGRTYYIVEGDLRFDAKVLKAYALEQARRESIGPADPLPDRLLGRLDDSGHPVRWAKGKVLTYAVLRQTFADGMQYQTVARNMRVATAAWEATCGVNFRHLGEHENGAVVGGEVPLFTVQGHPPEGNLLALAFFPDDSVERRQIFIYPSYFSPTLTYDLVGILRHELGHVLGFRHEHIRDEAPESFFKHEDDRNRVAPLTEYDSHSVMHYPI